MTPIEVDATTLPVLSVERMALESELVNHAEPVMERLVVEALSAVKGPTTVEEACATKPAMKVERPFTLKVPKVPLLPLTMVEVETPKVPVPETVSVPMFEVLVFKLLEVAVPRYEEPETESAVVEAYGSVEAMVVEVAKKYAAVGLLVAVSVVELVHALSMPAVPPETEAPGLEVAITFPRSSTAKKVPAGVARLVSHMLPLTVRLELDALVKKVVEAKTMASLSQSAVVVD